MTKKTRIAGALEKAGYSEGLEQADSPFLSPETVLGEIGEPAPAETVSSGPAAVEDPSKISQKTEPDSNSAAQPGSIEKIFEKPDTRPEVRPAPKNRVSKKLMGNWDKRLFKAVNEDMYLPEVFKNLRSRILHPKDGTPPPRTILVTSAVPREGKSFISANLGISLANGLDQHSLLVDCDLRRPTLAGLFGMNNNMGLVDFLRDDVPLVDLIHKTSVDKLSILPSGKSPVNPAELLSSAKMYQLIQELSARYEDRLIIFDSPPMLVASETLILAGQVDCTILVVRQGVSSKKDIRKTVDTIGADRIMGMVFNDHTVSILEKSVLNRQDYYQRYY
jgi:protein-tyrosine kinase